MEESKPIILPIVFVAGFCYVTGFSVYAIVAESLFAYYAINFIRKTNESIAFRELILFLYGLNYLCSPGLMYNGLEKLQYYPMRLDEKTYFELAIPAILMLHFGLFSVKTNIFSPNLKLLRENSKLIEPQLKVWAIGGVFLYILRGYLPSDAAFILYLLSMLRYVGVFGMAIINPFKYKYYLAGIFMFELTKSLGAGLFHDFIMWLIFFALLICYLYKPPMAIKVMALVIGICMVFILQLTKGEYRGKLKENDEGVSAFAQSVSTVNKSNSSGFFSPINIANALTRVNQAWILANTIDNLDKTLDFQEFHLLWIYAEAAFLPRALAPDKLTAGDKTLFNRFSGQTINEGTSMGLGFFADGYISFGRWGLFAFAFLLGFIFAYIFSVVDKWSNVSIFFILFIFPILSYAVRPDCETQTIMGHIVKSLFTYGVLARGYAWYFKNNKGILSIIIR